jgi:uncharacterized protein (TIGR02598 family)
MKKRTLTAGSFRVEGKAFTLVEVLLAIGVVSFAMVGILGLIPAGLNTFRSTMFSSVESGIVHQLAGEVQRTDFDNQNTATQVYYFDNQGIAAASAREALFIAEVCPPQLLTSNGVLPSTSAARTIVIKITNRTNPAITNSYPVVIPVDS